MALKYQGNLLKESNQGVNRPNRHRLDTVVELEAGRTYTFDMDGWTGGGDWSTTFEVELTNGQHTITVQARNYNRGLYTATFNAPHTITHVYITNGRTKTNNWNSSLEWATLVEGTEKQTWWSAPLDDPIVKVEGDIIANKIYWGSRELARVYLGEQLVWELQQTDEQTDEQIEDTPIKLTGVHGSQTGINGILTLPAVSRLSELGVDIYQVKQIEINGELFKVKDVRAFSSITFVYLDRPLGFRLTGDETIYLHTN